MPKLTPDRAEEVVRVLEKLGFSRVRQSGSHAIFRHQDGRWVTVPIYKGRDLGKGILRKILKDAGISVNEFNKMR